MKKCISAYTEIYLCNINLLSSSLTKVYVLFYLVHSDKNKR